MAFDDDGDEARVPVWMVTFGDMMSLLLTFFVMLVSMSDVKSDERYQAVIESMSRRFGHNTSADSMTSDPIRPRNSQIAKAASEGRSKRMDNHRAMVGKEPSLGSIRPRDETRVGEFIEFAEDSDQLTDETKKQLQMIAAEIAGKPQKIDIRGHTSQRTADGSRHHDNWELAYNRCHRTMKFLVSLGIEPHRFRLSVAAAVDPKHLAGEQATREQNARVEVLLLSEMAAESGGTPGEIDRLHDTADDEPKTSATAASVDNVDSLD